MGGVIPIMTSLSMSNISSTMSSARIVGMNSSDAFLFKVEGRGGGAGFMSSFSARGDREGSRGVMRGDGVVAIEQGCSCKSNAGKALEE